MLTPCRQPVQPARSRVVWSHLRVATTAARARIPGYMAPFCSRVDDVQTRLLLL